MFLKHLKRYNAQNPAYKTVVSYSSLLKSQKNSVKAFYLQGPNNRKPDA